LLCSAYVPVLFRISFRELTTRQKGFLGSAVLDQLIKAGFDVTVLTRSHSSIQGVPAGVAVLEVDYTSTDSLEHALRGHDAVVSTVNSAAFMIQQPAIDASIRAGVKRFIPADFGALTTAPESQGLPVHARPVEYQNYLKEMARLGELEYTILAVGLFLDYVVSSPFVVDRVNRTAVLYDSLYDCFSRATVSGLGLTDILCHIPKYAKCQALYNPAPGHRATSPGYIERHRILLELAARHVSIEA
jgi:putative NADH-flavin reductase